MNITLTHHDDYAVVAVEGRLTATGVPRLRQTIDEAVAAGRPRVVVDMGGMDFIDSSGIGALIGGLKSTRLAEGDLRIAAVPEAVRRVLKLTNLDRVLREYPTAEAAFDAQ
jgi:anti-sigma B factor antagonist